MVRTDLIFFRINPEINFLYNYYLVNFFVNQTIINLKK
jgi:hypothetical protein